MRLGSKNGLANSHKSFPRELFGLWSKAQHRRPFFTQADGVDCVWNGGCNDFDFAILDFKRRLSKPWRVQDNLENTKNEKYFLDDGIKISMLLSHKKYTTEIWRKSYNSLT